MYIIIVGCGKIGASLAKTLQNDHNVVVIDKDQSSFAQMGRSFNGISLEGNGLDLDILKEAGIERTDALAATTNHDNTNIAIAQIAKKIFNVQKVSVMVSDPEKGEIYRKLGVDAINSTSLIAALIRDKIIEQSFSTYILESNNLTIVEIKSDSLYEGKKVKDLNIPGEFQIITVVRGEEPIIPEENLIIKSNDILVGLAKISSLKRIRRTIKLI